MHEMKNRTIRMAMLLVAAAIFTPSAFAWGPGHDTVARCILEKMPSEWRQRFKSEWMRPYLGASHLPDRGNPSLLRPADLEWLAANCGYKGDIFVLHKPQGLIGEAARLVHAIRVGDDYAVFMHLATLSHIIADPVACNHDPIIHVLTYIWSPEALDVLPKTGRPMPVDFVFAEHDADTKAVLARRLAALEIPPVPGDVTAESLSAEMLSWEYRALDQCSGTSQRIVENGARWMETGELAAKCAAADALCDLGLWSVARTLYVFEAARRLAAAGEMEVTPELIEKWCKAAKTNEAAVALRPMENDSFARPYFPDKGRPMKFAMFYDPTAHMASGVFSAPSSPFACQVVGSLKRIRPDLNAGLFDARVFAREGLDPKVTPYAMVFRRVWPWRNFDVKGFNARLAEYKKAGGKVIWVEGCPPDYVVGKETRRAMSDGGLRDGYAKPVFPVPMDEFRQCSLVWVGPGGRRSWSYRRKPEGKAGWTWCGSPWRFDPEKLPKDAKPILEMHSPTASFVTGVAVPGAVYLPNNALFPYCLTDEKPSMSPFALSLDSAGEAILGAVLSQFDGTIRPVAAGNMMENGDFETGNVAGCVSWAPGTKELDAVMEVTPADGGKVFTSSDPANPAILSGGRTITGWRVGDDGVWRVTLPEVKSGKWNFSQLFVNGERRRRPCVPSEGFYFTTDNAYTNEPGMPFCGFVYDQKNTALKSDYANMRDIEVEIFYNWSVAKMRLAGIDLENHTVRFTSGRRLSKRHSTHKRPRRWHLENVKEAFGRAGEWYLDRPTGVLSYKPFPGETPDKCHVVAPYLKQILRVKGEKGKPVKDVVFRNVRFKHANVVVPEDGAYVVQGELDVPAAVELTCAENVRFESCVFESVGGWAVAFGPGCYGNAVDSCLLRDLGAGGVKVGAPYGGYSTIEPGSVLADWKSGATVPGYGKKAWELTGDTRVENCRIVHGGEVYHAGMGVLAGRTFGAKILHNEIAHFDYTAISVGWDWNNKVVMAHDNEVAFNHCWDIGRRVLSDMGVVYTLGNQPGTTIHDNHLHGIDVYEYGGKGIYLDECTSHVKVFNNLIYDTRCSHSQSFTIGCEVYNNIFYCPKRGANLLWRTKAGSDDVAMNAHHNIVVWNDESEAFEKCADFTATPEQLRKEAARRLNPASGSRLDFNLYWKIGSGGTNGLFSSKSPPARKTGDDADKHRFDFAAWRTISGGDANSVLADPKFVDAAAFDFRLKPDSPALKLGFTPFDYHRAGLSDPSRVPDGRTR